MATARGLLEDLGYAEVSSYVNSGNLLFSASGSTDALEAKVRAALETEFGFELTTFVRTAAQVRTLVEAEPFTLKGDDTHFVLFPLTRMTPTETRAVQAMSNDHDELVIRGRDVHWLIHSKSTETTLGPTDWKKALPDNPSTARNMTMLTKLADRL